LGQLKCSPRLLGRNKRGLFLRGQKGKGVEESEKEGNWEEKGEEGNFKLF